MSLDTYPIAIVEDRFDGAYSGGEWLAISHADVAHNSITRIEYIMFSGPADEIDAPEFWKKSPKWIGVGGTPDQAINNLKHNLSK